MTLQVTRISISTILFSLQGKITMICCYGFAYSGYFAHIKNVIGRLSSFAYYRVYRQSINSVPCIKASFNLHGNIIPLHGYTFSAFTLRPQSSYCAVAIELCISEHLFTCFLFYFLYSLFTFQIIFPFLVPPSP